jgi:hypothetical protein
MCLHVCFCVSVCIRGWPWGFARITIRKVILPRHPSLLLLARAHLHMHLYQQEIHTQKHPDCPHLVASGGPCLLRGGRMTEGDQPCAHVVWPPRCTATYRFLCLLNPRCDRLKRVTWVVCLTSRIKCELVQREMHDAEIVPGSSLPCRGCSGSPRHIFRFTHFARNQPRLEPRTSSQPPDRSSIRPGLPSLADYQSSPCSIYTSGPPIEAVGVSNCSILRLMKSQCV